MNIVEIARAMSRRMPWPVARRLLREHGIPRSQGWEKTIDALDGPLEDHSEKEEDLEEALVEHLLCGEKLVRFYKVSRQKKAELVRAVSALKIPESTFLENFPGYLPSDELEDAPTNPTLVRVVELAFGTTTASNKVEKMRRKSLCLREETYHKGGKAALSTPIEPYRLSVIWKLVLSDGKFSLPELSLNSSTRVANSASPFMSDAIIRNCMGFSDYNHVISRMEHFLSAP